jgi:hypothetical protein
MNRLAICEAYYVYASLYHTGQWSKPYRIFARLNRIGFRPRLNLSEASLCEDGRECLRKLLND